MIVLMRLVLRLFLTAAFSASFVLGADVGVERAMSEFVTALNNLDWRTVSGFFDANATMFSPTIPERIEGSQLEAGWRKALENLRSRSTKLAPPYLDVKPQGMRIDQLSDDIAVVTFRLPSPTGVGLRTFIWKRFSDRWKIVHQHASSVEGTAK